MWERDGVTRLTNNVPYIKFKIFFPQKNSLIFQIFLTLWEPRLYHQLWVSKQRQILPLILPLFGRRRKTQHLQRIVPATQLQGQLLTGRRCVLNFVIMVHGPLWVYVISDKLNSGCWCIYDWTTSALSPNSASRKEWATGISQSQQLLKMVNNLHRLLRLSKIK